VLQSLTACCKKLDWSDEPLTIKPLTLSLNESGSYNKSKEANSQVSIFYHTSFSFLF